MKTKLLIAMLAALLLVPLCLAVTYEDAAVFPWIRLTSTDTTPPAVAGALYFDTSETLPKVYTGSVWTALGTGTFTGGTITSNTTLDDGTGDSPSLILKDATDQTATFSKVDGNYLTLTTLATIGMNILTGNFKVGNGVPDVTPDGEDAYIEGTLEVDGAARFDGAVAVNGAVTCTSSISGDGGDALKGFLKTMTDDDNGKTLNVNESGTVQTNAGAAGAAAWTLPGAAAGLEYTFVVMAAQQLRVTPAAGDAIYIGSTAGDAAEYWWADAPGETLHLIAVDATNWVAVSYTGTWTQQTP